MSLKTDLHESLAIIAALFSWHFVYTTSPAEVTMHQVFIAVNLTLCWLGGGRCLGIDYFFFKRNRGIWW